VPSPEVINNASFMVIMPLTFVSNAFVPTEQFPSWLQPIVEWNPVSTLIEACRQLFGNVPEGVPEPSAWPMQNPVIYTLLWSVIILVVFAPLAVRQYKRAVLH
jgi:ABC-type multidrug transport system permease subunit